MKIVLVPCISPANCVRLIAAKLVITDRAECSETIDGIHIAIAHTIAPTQFYAVISRIYQK